MTEKVKKYLQFLNYLHDCFRVSRDGNIRISLINECKDHSVSQYAATALPNLGIIERIEKGVYRWKTTAVPNEVMATSVVCEVSKMAINYTKRSVENRNKDKRVLTPVADVVKAAEEKIMNKMIKASKVASLFGKNIGELEEEKIKELMNTI